MSAQATQATPQEDPGPDATDMRAADTCRHRQALNDLVDMGTDLARLLHGQAVAQAAQAAQQPTDARPAPAPAPGALVSLAAVFDQVARAVRRCIMLAQSLDKFAAPAPDPARQRVAARKRILREVEDTIQRTSGGHGESPDSIEALNAELRDRLDAPDLDDDITTRPVAEIIIEIRRDLGLDANPGTRPFKRRTPADVAQLRARAAAPSAARQPSASPEELGPQDIMRRAAQRPPVPQPEQCGAADTAATPGARLASLHTVSSLPDDPAAAIATILGHPTRDHARWRPSLEG